MANKRKLHPDKERQIRAEKQNRGTGNRESYLPYIQVRRHDFASHGRSHRFPSPFWPRHHELLSDLELHVLLHVQLMRPHDIREQFPLLNFGIESDFSKFNPEANGTVDIAKKLGIKHPAFAKDDYMTFSTDMLVTLGTGAYLAIHVKYKKDLAIPKNIGKRTIEKEYWEQRGVRFVIITEENMNKNAVWNLMMLASVDKTLVGEVTQTWLYKISMMDTDRPMMSKLREIERKTGESYDVLVNRIKYSVLTGQLRLNLSERVLQWDLAWPEMTTNIKNLTELLQVGMTSAN